MSVTTAACWLVQTALGGGLLLLAARWLMVRTAAPAARQRLGEVGVLAALLLGAAGLAPAWLPVSLPDWLDPAPVAEPAHLAEVIPATPLDEISDFTRPASPLPGPTAEPAGAEDTTAVRAAPIGAFWRQRGAALLVGVYASLAAVFLARWLLAHVALAWLLRCARPAPAWVTQMLLSCLPEAGEEGVGASRARRLRILVSPRVRTPFSFGLVRPTMVLPTALLGASSQEIRWVLAHEASHLRRGDGWGAMLLAAGQSAFFYVPWFWWLRRQVRLCQEHVADAAALAAGGRPEDYAEFLLTWTNRVKTPRAALGVSGNVSDLYQRVSLLLQPQPPAPIRPLRGLTAGVILLTLAVVLPALHVRSQAAEPLAKTEPGKELPSAPPAVADLDGLLPQLPDDRVRERSEQGEAMRRRLERRWPDGAVALEGGRLGVRVRPPEPALVDQLQLPANRGMVVVEVRPGSPAARAGLRRHDVLLELDGRAVSSEGADFARLLAGVGTDDPVGVLVVRKGRKVALDGLALPGPAARPNHLAG